MILVICPYGKGGAGVALLLNMEPQIIMARCIVAWGIVNTCEKERMKKVINSLRYSKTSIQYSVILGT